MATLGTSSSGNMSLSNKSRPQSDLSNKYDLVYESESQTKGFNFPFQLGWGRNGDDPSTAWDFTHKIKNNDVIVVGSDGLFDNVSGSDVT